MANKGEWSEVYVFLRLLAEGRLYCGDGWLNRYDDRWYDILEVFRDDSPTRNEYRVIHAKKSILAVGDCWELELPQGVFMECAMELLEQIRGKGDTSRLNDVRRFMSDIGCGGIKAKSTDKADIRIVIHNCNTGSKPELGYSVKSRLGAPSTLINSNRDGTNFVFAIEGLNESVAGEVNGLKRFKAKFDEISKCGASWRFSHVASSIFHNNLLMLDMGIERIVADCLGKYYSGQAKSVEDAIRLVSEDNPFGFDMSGHQPMYEYKMKQFLLAFALGMTPTTPWMGQFNANGGYIVVKEDGDIVCYHFFDRNDLEDYLFYNTVFDTPSTSRHGFGEVYREDGQWRMKLNLQIRFK